MYYILQLDVISPRISGRKRRGQSYSGHFCCAPGCSNQSGKDRQAGISRHYYLFPKDVLRRRAWMRAIPRDKWHPSSSSKICSDHFVGGKTIFTQNIFLFLQEYESILLPRGGFQPPKLKTSLSVLYMIVYFQCREENRQPV